MTKRLSVAAAALCVIAVLVACPPPQATQSEPATTRSLCYHTDTSEWVCPDTNSQSQVRGFLIPLADYQGATLTVTERNGRTHTIPLGPNVDAIFTSKSAVENFLLRYYDDTDKAKAAELRRRLETNWP